MKKIITILIILLLVVPFARVRSMAASNVRFNGANIVYYWKGDWNNTEETLDRLKYDGSNSVSICIIWYQKNKRQHRNCTIY